MRGHKDVIIASSFASDTIGNKLDITVSFFNTDSDKTYPWTKHKKLHIPKMNDLTLPVKTEDTMTGFVTEVKDYSLNFGSKG